MNRTIFLALNNNTTPEQEKKEAQLYFKNFYGDEIEYIEAFDCFKYKGIYLDYFKSGAVVNWDGKNELSGSYMLVDPENYRDNWLYTYGDKVKMWEKFIEKKYPKNKIKNMKEFLSYSEKRCLILGFVAGFITGFLVFAGWILIFF